MESHKVPENRCFSGLLGYRRLIESKVDAVFLEAPPYAFPDHATAAVKAGCHVYMAKPVAVDVPGCRRITDLGKEATKNRKVFLVDFQMRTDPFAIESVKRCHDGLIGPIFLLSSHYSSEGFPDPEKTDTIEGRLQRLIWTNDIAIGGGQFVNAGIHAIDAALWIARELPVSASGCTRTMRANPHGDSPDVDALIFQFKSGLVLNHFGEHVRNTHQFLCTAYAYGRDGYLETSYTGNSFVRGNKGGYKGGPATNLYEEGIKRNLDTFHKNVLGGIYDNPTVEQSVNSTLATILGREAGARNSLITWDRLLQEDKRVAVDLTGLKE
jgi:predicted dehydrogenase